MGLGNLLGRWLRKNGAAPPGAIPIWAGQAALPAEAGAAAMQGAADAALRGDGAAARRSWARARLAMGARMEAWTLAAASHAAEGEMGDAEALLVEARTLFPADPQPSHDLAALEEQRGGWAAAERHWRDFIAIDETKWWAFARLVDAVRRQGNSAHAEAVLEWARTHLPQSSDLAAETARFLQREGRPAEALDAWATIVAQFPQDWTGYHGMTGTLLDLGRLADAAGFVASHAAAFAESAEAQVDIAQVAERRADWRAAEAAWTRAIALGQGSDWDYRGHIRALRALGHTREADGGAERAVAKHPGQPTFRVDFALALESRGEYRRAADHWHAAAALVPSESSYLAREAACRSNAEMAGTPGRHATEAGVAGEDLDERALMLRFESLGGTGHGCEFGIFQRQFGAEPLGLLRWADLGPDQLCEALETGFDGVGEPEHTEVFVPGDSEPPEYWTRDLRYHMAMRCFVFARDVPLDKMRDQVTRRLRFLRSKLLEDLAAGEKIFVYKNVKRNLTDAELRRLHAVCRRYGGNTLLYVRYADQANPNRTVVAAGPGLLVAFVDHFSHAPDTDAFLGTVHDDLLAICREACAISRRSPSPLSDDAWAGRPMQPEDNEAAVQRRIDAARSARDAGRHAEAADMLEAARADLGWHPELAIESGWAAHIAGRMQEAADWWAVVREKTPHHVVGYVNGAQAATRLGLPEEAERILALGAERLPGHGGLLAEYAASAAIRQDWPEASRRSLLVIDRDPGYRPAWLSAARAFRAQSLFDDADAVLDGAAQRFAPDHEIMTERCWVAHLRRDWPEADRRWAALREAFPAAVDGWVNGARACRELGRFDDAETILVHAARSRLDMQTVLSELAWLAQARGDWPLAATRWRTVRGAYPDSPVAWHREAGALAEMGQRADAIALSHRTLERFPDADVEMPELLRLDQSGR